MKTKQELDCLREEFRAMSRKLAELTEEELAQVTGGAGNDGTIFNSDDPYHEKEIHVYKNTLDEFDKPKWH